MDAVTKRIVRKSAFLLLTVAHRGTNGSIVTEDAHYGRGKSLYCGRFDKRLCDSGIS